MKEIWKDIKDYEGLYQVSNCGNIRSMKRNIILKPSINHKGYLQVVLYKNNISKTKRIHRLVAENFILNLQNKPQINHIDGNKRNNNLNNLEWCTNSENQKHAFANKLQKDISGKNNPKARKINQYDKNNNFIKQWDCIKDISINLKIHYSSIIRCCNGTYKTCKGFIWRYAN